MPARGVEHLIEGVMTGRDGQPLAGVWLELRSIRSGYTEGDGVKTNAEGRFSFKALEGQAYELTARAAASTKRFRLIAGQESKPLKLVIE